MPQSRRSTFLEVLTERLHPRDRSRGAGHAGFEWRGRSSPAGPESQPTRAPRGHPGPSVSASPPPDRVHRAGGVGPNRLPRGDLDSGRCSGGGGPPGGGVSGSSAPGCLVGGGGAHSLVYPGFTHSFPHSFVHSFIHPPCSFPPPPTILSPLPSSPSPGFVSIPRLWGPCLVCCLAPPPQLQRRLQASLSRVTGSTFSCLEMTPAVAVGTQEKGTHARARMHTHVHTHVRGETS